MCIWYEVETEEYDDVRDAFFGRVVTNLESITAQHIALASRLYLCGNVDKIMSELAALTTHKTCYVVRKVSFNMGSYVIKTIGVGQMPLDCFGVGVYFRRLFDESQIFDNVESEYTFQTLTNRTKPESRFALASI